MGMHTDETHQTLQQLATLAFLSAPWGFGQEVRYRDIETGAPRASLHLQ